MHRQFRIAGLGLALSLGASVSLAGNCGTRDNVISRLQSHYAEEFAIGGLQATQDTQAVMEVWASRETGTFTVLLTTADGMSCIVAAGTDFFEAAPPRPHGTAG